MVVFVYRKTRDGAMKTITYKDPINVHADGTNIVISFPDYKDDRVRTATYDIRSFAVDIMQR